jgi:hypothetical protein
MIKKLKRQGKEEAPLHMDVGLPDGRRVLLPLPAFGLAVRYGMIKAQLSEEERQAFDVVSVHSEYSAMKKIIDEATVLTRMPKPEDGAT